MFVLPASNEICSGCSKRLQLGHHSITKLRSNIQNQQCDMILCNRCIKNQEIQTKITNIICCYECNKKQTRDQIWFKEPDGFDHIIYYDKFDLRLYIVLCSTACRQVYLNRFIEDNKEIDIVVACHHCDKKVKQFIKCNRCSFATYCNINCMRSDRSKHKLKCNN